MKPKEYEVIFKFTVASTVPFPSTLNWNAEPIGELIRCKDCKWGREISGNIECNADMNNPPEYHGYKWFCPLGERKEE